MTLISLLLPSNHREGRSALKPRKHQRPSTCLTENVWASVSTGPTTAEYVRMDGAAPHVAHALYWWLLSARTVSVSRGRPCSSSHVNAAMTVATSMKWPSPHSTGCMEIHTSSQTSTEKFYFIIILIHWGQLSWRRKMLWDQGQFFLILLRVSEDHRHPPDCQTASRQGRLGSQRQPLW